MQKNIQRNQNLFEANVILSIGEVDENAEKVDQMRECVLSDFNKNGMRKKGHYYTYTSIREGLYEMNMHEAKFNISKKKLSSVLANYTGDNQAVSFGRKLQDNIRAGTIFDDKKQRMSLHDHTQLLQETSLQEAYTKAVDFPLHEYNRAHNRNHYAAYDKVCEYKKNCQALYIAFTQLVLHECKPAIYFDNFDFIDTEKALTTPPHVGFLDKICSEAGSLLSSTDKRTNVGISPGINRSSFYIGTPLSTSCMHIEDDRSTSINVVYAGEPKLWLIIPPLELTSQANLFGSDSSTLNYAELFKKKYFMTLEFLETNKIVYEIFLQAAGTTVIIKENVMHQVINLGTNFAEAVNFGSHRSNFTKIVHGNVTHVASNPCLSSFEAVDISYCLSVAKAVAPKKCPHCVFEYSNRSMYTVHIRKEHGELSGKCSQCPMLVPQSKLANHRATHFKDQYVCYICANSLRRFNKHMEEIHKFKLPIKAYRDPSWNSRYYDLLSKANKDEVPIRLEVKAERMEELSKFFVLFCFFHLSFRIRLYFVNNKQIFLLRRANGGKYSARARNEKIVAATIPTGAAGIEQRVRRQCV